MGIRTVAEGRAKALMCIVTRKTWSVGFGMLISYETRGASARDGLLTLTAAAVTMSATNEQREKARINGTPSWTPALLGRT
jgi:hypothetical protein